MSKLIDKLNRISGTMSQPIGFTTSRSLPEKPRMLLIASSSFPPNVTVNSVAGYCNSADACLMHITNSNLEASIVQETTQSLPEVPWGMWLGNIGKTEIAAAYKAGSDFVVFPATSKVTAIPQDDKLGKILQVESSLSDDSLKAVICFWSLPGLVYGLIQVKLQIVFYISIGSCKANDVCFTLCPENVKQPTSSYFQFPGQSWLNLPMKRSMLKYPLLTS